MYLKSKPNIVSKEKQKKTMSAKRREMSRGGGVKVVCVTGASGYVASWLVKLLLHHGYTIKATVRTLDDPRKTEHLLALDGAKERLHLFEADLIEEGSFDSVVNGCDGVFHTASPVSLSVTDPQVELIDPAVKGTLNVLRSCAKVSSIKRVVVTSSIASVSFNGRPLNSDVVVDETWFSDPAFCQESKLWYPLSKTLAEGAAWKFAKENGIDLVTLHPGYVIGPLLQPTLNFTSEVFLNIIKSGTLQQQIERTGTEVFSWNIYRYVDVRDVAYAHIQAFEIPSASGRYCLVESVTYHSEVLKILHKLYPALHFTEKSEDEKKPVEPEPLYHVSKEKAKTLGIDFIPLEVSIKGTVESLKDKKFLNL